MRIVAAAVLVLGGVVSALAADPQRYECPAVDFSADAGPSVVAFSTILRNNQGQIIFQFARRAELARADRVCTRRRQGREERLRSFPIRGTARPHGPARNRVQLALEDRLIDLDTSAAISVLLPETPDLPAYACYRLLSDNPAARLCLPSDFDGTGEPGGKGLFCNRGRCRDRKVLGVSGIPDNYEGAWDAGVTLPGSATTAPAVTVTTRTAPGRIATDVALGTRDVLSLRMRLRARRRLLFAGDRQTGTDAAIAVDGTGRATRFADLTITADLTSVQGGTALTMTRKDADPSPTRFAGCWLLTIRADGPPTTLRLPLIVSPNGLGASRPTEELADDGSVVTTLAAGDCAVTTSGRLSCSIPSGDTDVRLFGSLGSAVLGPASEFAVGTDGRTGTWTAVRCPES